MTWWCVLLAIAAETDAAPASSAPAKPRRRPQFPMQKRGPLAFENVEMEIGQSVCGARDARARPLRLLVHAVNDDTNRSYVKEVEPFLRRVRWERLPFATASDRDLVLASALDKMCFVDKAPMARGQKLYHGLVHVFPEWKAELPIALRSLHSWERMQATWEGGPASKETIYHVAEQSLVAGHVDEAIAYLVAYDGYLREQDWLQLRGEDIHVEVKVAEDGTSTFRTALLFGRRHRGESVKTGQEQGVAVDEQFLAQLLAHRKASIGAGERVFATTAVRAGKAWRDVLGRLGLEWIGPLHTLRHSGPSHDLHTGRRQLPEIQRRGRWSQAKSVQRYAKPHALIIHNARLPAHVKNNGRELIHSPRRLLARIPKSSDWFEPAQRVLSELPMRSTDRAVEPPCR